MPTVDDLRQFSGADPDIPDAMLERFLKAAVEWYRTAGVPPIEDNALYAHWVLNLASWFFDNRGLSGADAHIPPYIVASAHQLRPYASKAVEK